MAKANEAAGQSQSAVQAAKEKMIKLNLANADPDLAASLSVGQAGLLNQPPKFDPLVDVFENITEGLASREEVENRRKIRDQINLISLPQTYPVLRENIIILLLVNGRQRKKEDKEWAQPKT